jgi:K+-sensing histidine kinase KdpD
MYGEERRVMKEYALDSVLLRWAIIGASVAFGVLTVEAFSTMEVDAPYLPFLPGIVVCCLLGGFRMGAAATVLSGVCLRYFFMKPYYSLQLPSCTASIHVLLFLGVMFFTCYAINLLIKSNNELSRDNFVLGHKMFLILRELRRNAAGHDIAREAPLNRST